MSQEFPGATDQDPSGLAVIGQRLSQPTYDEVVGESGVHLVMPDEALVREIAAESNGVAEYFPADSRFAVDKSCNQEGAYVRYIVEPMLERIEEQFPGKSIALRGIATSVNGDLDIPYYDETVHDATAISRHGIEKPGDDFNVVHHINGTDTMTNYGLKHMYEYAAKVGRPLGAEAHSDLFPAILVYDAGMLEPTDEGGRYTVKLREGSKPSDALLKMYITDKLTVQDRMPNHQSQQI